MVVAPSQISRVDFSIRPLGTWVPIDRGVALAQQYGVDHLLKPIFDFVPTETSPPPAPKHITAPPARPKRKADVLADIETASQAGASTRGRGLQGSAGIDSDSELSKPFIEEERSISPTPSDVSSSSRTPSPIHSARGTPAGYDDGLEPDRRRRRLDPAAMVDPSGRLPGGPARYARMILDYFVSETTQIPSFLISPPADFDPNVIIDDDGHTALHWACAMGRIRIVKLLLTAGADVFRANYMGQTALMRSVMFTNNYDLRKFPELFELLHRSTINIDRNDRTVFHYVVDIALQKGKTHAARYYCETILARLVDYPREVADILNFQDEDGETALTLAARARSKRLVKILLDAGADPKLPNRDGKSAEDYILEDERFRAADLGPTGSTGLLAPGLGAYAPQLHHSETAQRASGEAIPQAATMLESLANSFDAELQEKERDLAQAHALLGNIQAEILDSQRTVNGLKQQASGWDESRKKEEELRNELSKKMGKRFRLGWGKFAKDESERADGSELGLEPGLLNGQGDVEGKSSELKKEIEGLQDGRKELFETFVKLQSESGTGTKMGDYRKLIGLGCDMPVEEVDGVIATLVETLEAEDGQVAGTINAGATANGNGNGAGAGASNEW